MTAQDNLHVAELRYRWGKRVLVTLAAFVALAILGLLLVGQQQARDQQQQARDQRQDIEKVLGVLLECTTDPAERKDATVKPGPDDCFVRSRQRFDALADQIGGLSIVASACGAANPGDVVATRKCVEDALAE